MQVTELRYHSPISSKKIEFASKIHEEVYDHVVIGGGAAGLASAEIAARKGLKVILIEKSDRLGGNADSMLLPNGMLVPKGSSVFGPGAHPKANDYVTETLGIPLNHYPIYPGYVILSPTKRLSFDPLNYSSSEELSHGLEITQFAYDLRKKLGFPSNGHRIDHSVRDNPHLLRYDTDPIQHFKDTKPTLMNLVKPWSRSDTNLPYTHVSPLALEYDIASYLQLDTTTMVPGGNHSILKEIESRLRKNANVTILTHTNVLELKDTKKGNRPIQLKIKDGLGTERYITAKQAHIAAGPRAIPKLFSDLPANQKGILNNSFSQGPYILVGLVLNTEKTGTPLLSQRFFFCASPAAKYIADGALINEQYNQNMFVKTKSPSVFACYAPIPMSQWKNPPSPKTLVKRVKAEVLLHLPEIKKAGIKDVYFKYYPKGILAPRPGEVAKIHQVPEQLSPNIRWIDASASGMASSFSLALHGAIRAFDQKK